ncbi:TPA: winged helix-turn-helix domain-containing protein [Klebsiella aerogenes]|nr:winged helix-turn-helix domain-containing protein [Klebsiella aerogenes]
MSNAIYLIDKIVRFDKERMILTNVISHDTVTLTSNLGECLFILINNQGKTIRHEYFINEVWGKKKMLISENTLVQNIRKLRNNMNSVGLRRDYILTKKNEGYYFSSEIDVTLINCQNEIIDNTESELKLHTLKGGFTNPFIGNIKKIYGKELVILIVFIIYILIFEFYYTNAIASINYNYTTKVSECEFYFDNKLDYKNPKILDVIIRQNKINCNVRSYIYITFYPLSPHYSYIKCNEGIESKIESKTCTSVVRYNYAKDI